MAYYDPDYKGWYCLRKNSFGTFMYWTYEDIFFYFGAFFMFYMIYRLNQYLIKKYKIKDFKCHEDVKVIFFTVLINICAFMLFFSHACGVTLTLMFALPACAMMIFLWNHINSKILLLFTFEMIFIEMSWDLTFVSFIRKIASWASGWRYMSKDALGAIYHSNVFHPGWWLFECPLEITPYYAVSGAPYAFLLILLLDRKFYPKKSGLDE
jgi:hypothetical protein